MEGFSRAAERRLDEDAVLYLARLRNAAEQGADVPAYLAPAPLGGWPEQLVPPKQELPVTQGSLALGGANVQYEGPRF